MMPAWIVSIIRHLAGASPAKHVDMASPASPNATRAPSTEADLEFVGTAELFAAIASRYDGCVIVCVRHPGSDDAPCSAVFLSRGVEQPEAFLRSSASLLAEHRMRELREDDL